VCSETNSAQESGTTPDTITVEEFEFVVNHPVFTQAELKSFTKGYLNKALSKAQLLSVATEITKQYAARGYSTSSAVVCLPKTQQQGKRAAIIRIIEGELERIDVKSPPVNKEDTEGSRMRLNPNYVRARFALAASKPLNVNKLQEALQLLQKDPLIESASFRLLPGSSPSQSILEVEVKEAKSFSASLSNDINGFSSWGTSQQQVVLSEANLLGIGDSLSVGYIDTEITHDWNLSYTLPLNAHNGTLSFTYNQSQAYGIPELNGSVPVKAQSVSEAASLERSTISSPFDSLHESGNHSNVESTLRSYELTLRQPVIRRIRGENAGKGEPPTYEEFALGLTAFLGKSPTTSSQVPLSLSSLPNDNGLARTLALRFFQEWKRENARDSIELRSRFSVGVNALSSTINEPLAQVNPVPATTFFSWQGEAQWTHILAQDTLLLVRANAQLANRTLVPSEQFALGGKGGYLQHSLLTDNGIFASAEVQLPVLRVFRGKGVIQVIPFVDFGTAWNSSGQANPSPNTLASVGLGLQWQQENFTARLDWGIPLVSVDSPYGTGQENRLYFSVQYHP
jgi:hemolysin activation/secretion protein